MKAVYETPKAEIIDFYAMRSLAIIEDDKKDPELGVGSREDLD